MPANLNLQIALETPIRAETAAIGDALTARLNKPIRISENLTAPRGALVRGRVRVCLQLQDPPDTYEIGVEFNEIDWPGHVGVFLGKPVDIEQLAGLSTHISRGTTQTYTNVVGRWTNSRSELISPAQIPGVATFFLAGSHVIPKGFGMVWRTERTKHF